MKEVIKLGVKLAVAGTAAFAAFKGCQKALKTDWSKKTDITDIDESELDLPECDMD